MENNNTTINILREGDVLECIKSLYAPPSPDGEYYDFKQGNNYVCYVDNILRDDNGHHIVLTNKELKEHFIILGHFSPLVEEKTETSSSGKTIQDVKEDSTTSCTLFQELSASPEKQDEKERKDNTDNVNHPNHYTWIKKLCGVEVLDIARHLDFNTGNVLKYILRAGYKSEKGMTVIEKQIEDLKKAKFYLEDEIKLYESINAEYCE